MHAGDDRSWPIVGTLVLGVATQPFVFDAATNEVQLDVYAPAKAGASVTAVPENFAELLSTLLGFRVDAVRLGEYYCADCRNWLPADKNCWSITICLSCSLDRGTELAEYYEKLDRSG